MIKRTLQGDLNLTLSSTGKSMTEVEKLKAKETWYFDLESGNTRDEVGLKEFGIKPPKRL